MYIIFMFIILAITMFIGFVFGFLYFKSKANYAGEIIVTKDDTVYADLNDKKYLYSFKYLTFKVKKDA